MNPLALWKTLHLLGVCLFVGNIIVSAFWKVLADRTRDLAVVRFGSRLVNLTDAVFTGGGATLLAVSGHMMAPVHGGVLTTGWILWSYVLFGFSGLLWLAVLVPIQVKQARLLKGAVGEVPAAYYRLEGVWSAVGILATLVPLPALWMMITKAV